MHQAGFYAAKGSAALAYRAAKRLAASITPDEQEQLRTELGELKTAMRDTRIALVGRYAQRRRRRAWETRRDRVLHTPPHVGIAQMLVATLRVRGPMDEARLADAAGTTPEDADFRQALALALADGHITQAAEDGTLSARTAESLFERHPLLRLAEQTSELQDRIVNAVEDEGAQSLDELRAAVDVAGESQGSELAFDAALEQALATESVRWLGDGLYGIKAEDAAAFTVSADAPDLGKATQRLTRATIGLSRELAKLRRALKQAGPPLSEGQPVAGLPAMGGPIATGAPAPLPDLSFDEPDEPSPLAHAAMGGPLAERPRTDDI